MKKYTVETLERREEEVEKELLSKLDTLTSIYDKEQFYVKKKICPISYPHKREVEVYKLLEAEGIAPKLIDYGMFHHEEPYIDWYATYLVLERHGISLLDKYFQKREQSLFDGPGMRSTVVVENPDLFDEMFPVTRLSNDIREQIRVILGKLHEIGITHDDIHNGNFLINHDGVVKVIDFECVTFSMD